MTSTPGARQHAGVRFPWGVGCAFFAPLAPTAFLGSGERSRMDVKSHAFGAVDFVVSFVNGYLRAL